ncbi:MAG: FAD-binding oxidoreductase [Thermoplasmata archaeon]
MEPSIEGSLARSVRGSVRSDPASLEPFRHDRSHLEGTPVAVVAPADADDVVSLVRWARRSRVPLVPRGAGTSLDGESVPPNGSVVVDLSGWNRVLEVDPGELWARVGPGMVNLDLQAALHPYGVFFPPNPGSWTVATVGGNLGTNASGPRSYRYGPTRAWVRAVEAVLGTGERARFGTLVAKRSVGPDLLPLIVGSEGTLAIVTEVTVRLAPLPARREGLVFPLAAGVSLGAVARRLRQSADTGLSAVEYIDRASAAVLAERRTVGWPTGSALLLLEVEAESDREAGFRRERLVEVLRTVGVDRGPTVFADADQLWTLRGESSVVLDERTGHRVREDVAVPLGRIDELLARLEEIGRGADAPYYLFAHLGEGSFHPNYACDPASPTGDRVRRAVLNAALELGGSVSSEHGIGRLKVDFLERELGPIAVDLLTGLKRRFDPDGILNPGKLYPPLPPRVGGRPSPLLSGSGAPRAPEG